MNLERVTIRNEILIRRDFSILNSISHVKHELAMIWSKCRSGLKLNPYSCKLPPEIIVGQ